MIGSAGTLVDRKGGYLIPKLEKTTTTKTYTVIVPQNTIIAADNITIITGSEYLTKVVNGYAANKQDYTTVQFSVPLAEPVTIYNGKSILYVDSADMLYALTTPYNVGDGSGIAVVYNDEIHMLGGRPNYGATNHYRYNGIAWSNISTLPMQFYQGSAVVYNDEIHILGGSGNIGRSHYKWNGTSWTEDVQLPYSFYQGWAVVYKGKIHILGGSASNDATVRKAHCTFDGTTWTRLSTTLPYEFIMGNAVVYNDEIHILGAQYEYTKHYKFDGTSWSLVSTLPYDFQSGMAVVFDNKIHLIGGIKSQKAHYTFDGTAWTKMTDVPINVQGNLAAVHNNAINIMYTSNFYKYTGAAWSNTSSVKLFQTIPNMRINGNRSGSFGKKALENTDVTTILF